MSQQHISRSAEAYVESLLLRAGWNVWRPLLDDGVDMIATRGGDSVRLQVKSAAAVQVNGSYRFDLRKKTTQGVRKPRDWRGVVDWIVFVSGTSHVWVADPSECDFSAVALRVGSNGYWGGLFAETVK